MTAQDDGTPGPAPAPDDLPAAPPRPWWRRLGAHFGRLERSHFLALALALVTGALAEIAFTRVNLPYVIERPGPVFDVQDSIDPAPATRHGALYMTTVVTSTGRIVSIVSALLDPRAVVVPRTDVRPASMTPEQYERMSIRMMDESKVAAQVVGVRAAGYEVRLEGQGAQVQVVQSGSRATGLLMPGDVITAGGGDPVRTAADLVAVVRRFAPGDLLPLSLVRDGIRHDLAVPLGAVPGDPIRPRLGVVILTHIQDVDLPVPVQIRATEVGGSSAGLALALGVYQGVSGTDLTTGRKIAVTGALSPDGRVDPVAGVTLKVWAAEAAGAELFVLPEANREAATAAATRLQVVGVATFDEALRAIRAFTGQ